MNIDHLSYNKPIETRALNLKDKHAVPAHKQPQEDEQRELSTPDSILAPEYAKPDATIESKIIFIISGGEKREQDYFHIFKKEQHRLNTVIAFLSKKNQGLQPKNIYDKVVGFAKTKEFLTENGKSYSIEKDDIIHLLQDIDEFEDQIKSLPQLPQNVQWILSNPCFEMWLYYHYFDNPLPLLKQLIKESTDQRSQTLKRILDDLIPGGVQATKIIKKIEKATQNSIKNYSENGLIPDLFSTQMHNLATRLIQLTGNELSVLFKQKEEEANKMRQKYLLSSNADIITHSGQKINKFIDDLRNFASENPIKLPSTVKPIVGCPLSDKRVFSIGYKVPKDYFVDSTQFISNNIFELYYSNIVSNIKQYYLTIFAKRAPNRVIGITYNDLEYVIKQIIDIPGISVLTTIDLSNFQSTKQLKSYHYIDSDRPVIIILPTLYLPHIEHIQFGGTFDDYKQIDDVNMLYSNIYNMPNLSPDTFGLTILKELNIHTPQTSNLRYILFNVQDVPSSQSEVSHFSRKYTTELFYEKGDIIKYSDKLYQIESIQTSGDVTLQHLDGTVIPVNKILPVKANGVEDANIYYDPIIAANVVLAGQSIPVHHKDDSYYKDVLKKSFIEGKTASVFQQIQDCKFQYVHEIQHWMRYYMGRDELYTKIQQ